MFPSSKMLFRPHFRGVEPSRQVQKLSGKTNFVAWFARILEARLVQADTLPVFPNLGSGIFARNPGLNPPPRTLGSGGGYFLNYLIR